MNFEISELVYSYLNCGCRWKWRNDHRSKFSNLSNWKEEAWKKSGLQQDSKPWPPRYQCNALPTELWSHTLGARFGWLVFVSCYFHVPVQPSSLWLPFDWLHIVYNLLYQSAVVKIFIFCFIFNINKAQEKFGPDIIEWQSLKETGNGAAYSISDRNKIAVYGGRGGCNNPVSKFTMTAYKKHWKCICTGLWRIQIWNYHTIEYTMAFLYSDWLYFLWHGIKSTITSKYEPFPSLILIFDITALEG